MTARKENTSHILFIDGLRAIAALYVMIHHIILQYFNPDNISSVSGIKKILIEIFFQGQLAVNLFIVISGFSLMLSVINSNYTLRKGTWNFYARRSIRILPPYFFAIFLSLLLIRFFIGNFTGTHWDVSIPVTGMDVLTHIFLIHDIFTSHGPKINHALWSIAVEWRIYLLFPVLLLLWKKKGPAAAIICSLATVFFIYAIMKAGSHYWSDLSADTAGVDPYLVLFALGMLAADISFSERAGYKKIKELPYIWLTVLSLFLFLICRYAVTKEITLIPLSLSVNIMTIFFGLFISCFLVLCTQSLNRRNPVTKVAKLLAWKPLVFVGTFSYSLYLIHPPLIQVITQFIVSPLGVSAYTGTCIALITGILLIIPFAYLFFIVCERPFISILNKKKMSVAMFEATKSPAP